MYLQRVICGYISQHVRQQLGFGKHSQSSTRLRQEYNYIPEYIIEDKSNDTGHEIGTSKAVDQEILDDYDACFYADEPQVGDEQNAHAQHQKKIGGTQPTKVDGLEDNNINLKR